MKRPLKGIDARTIVTAVLIGLIPLVVIQVLLSQIAKRTLPADATISAYPTFLMTLVAARFVPMALGAYAAARAQLDSSPLRHGVLAAQFLMIVAMLAGLVGPLGLPAPVDFTLAFATAIAAGLYGAKAAVRRASAA